MDNPHTSGLIYHAKYHTFDEAKDKYIVYSTVSLDEGKSVVYLALPFQTQDEAISFIQIVNNKWEPSHINFEDDPMELIVEDASNYS